ncbi:MAG: hypothetical protein E7580_01190 [Ruminococcaceae bacterium]|nr:hypothetical protein [Oscillospiraceae bacterium]
MKQIPALLLALATLLSLVACSPSLASETKPEEVKQTAKAPEAEKNSEEEKKETLPPVLPENYPEGFTVGFARAIVTPENGTGLGGYGNHMTRLSKTVIDDLMLTCTAICDGENVVLLFSTDLVGIGPGIVNYAQSIIEKTYQIPKENVIFNATHSHSTPAMYNSNVTGMAKYSKLYYEAVKTTVAEALHDLAPAQILVGRSETEGLSYVRRYVNKITGEYLGKNLNPGQDPNVVAHESEEDEVLQVIRFDRAEKKDVVLVNWQCHPTAPGGENDTRVSSDFISSLREQAEADYDILVSYHQGAAGNLAQTGYLQGDRNNSADFYQQGRDIAKVVGDALQNATPAEPGKIQAKITNYKAAFKEEILNGTQTRVYSESIPLYTITVGDLAFCSIPGELHDSLGRDLRAASPYKMTFLCGYSNSMNGYIPAAFAFPNGGYEVDQTHYAQGTGEALIETHLAELNARKTAN